MPNAEKIIAAIERSNLVTADVVDQLRRKLERTPTMGLRAAVKWLVEKRQVTTAQGGRLLANIGDADEDDDDFDVAPSDRDDDARQTRGVPAAAEDDDDDLEMIPIDGDDAASDPGGKSTGRRTESTELPACPGIAKRWLKLPPPAPADAIIKPSNTARPRSSALKPSRTNSRRKRALCE